MNTRKLTLTALLTAIALCIFTAEAQLPSLTAIPGIKLGLANVVTVFAMYALGPGATLCIVLVRVTLGCIATGQMMAFSADGLRRNRCGWSASSPLWHTTWGSWPWPSP